MMKIDVSYEALLHTLVEAIRDERDHGAAMMTLVSRLVEQACQQDWFQAHWRTDARLRLAQMACGHMPKGLRSAVPVLQVIAEAARSALRADESDSDSRAILLAIMRLADVERSAGTMAKPKPRPVAKYTRQRKANGAGAVRRGRTEARPAKPAVSPQAAAGQKARPAAAKTAPARKAKRARPVSRSHTPAQLAKRAASPQAAARHKAKPTAAKTAPARKAKRAKPVSRSHTPAQLARPPVSPQPMAVAKAQPAAAKTAPARQPNGAAQASTKPGAPAIAT